MIAADVLAELHPPLLAYAHQLRSATPEDDVQEAFVSLLATPPDTADPFAWLDVAKERLVALVRAARRRPQVRALDLNYSAPADSRGPISAMRRERLRRALRG